MGAKGKNGRTDEAGVLFRPHFSARNLVAQRKKTFHRRFGAIELTATITSRFSGGDMERIFVRLVFVLCGVMLFVSSGYAKQHKTVYLKDGGMIDCESFWTDAGRVVIKVNRDTVVDFARDEVDLKRTFRKKAPRGKKHTAVAKSASATGKARPSVQGPVTSAHGPVQPGKKVPEAATTALPGKQKPAMVPQATPAGAKPAGTKPVTPSPAPPSAPPAKGGEAAKPKEGVKAGTPSVQGRTTSAKKPGPSAPAVRPALPMKPMPAAPPPPKEPLLDLQKIGIAALVLLLLVALLVRLRKKRGA
jgi:hypothetical protein